MNRVKKDTGIEQVGQSTRLLMSLFEKTGDRQCIEEVRRNTEFLKSLADRYRRMAGKTIK